jgi:hypothetical protein
MLRSAGFNGAEGAQRFKKETLLDIVSCDYRRLTEISKKMNATSQEIAGTFSNVLRTGEREMLP